MTLIAPIACLSGALAGSASADSFTFLTGNGNSNTLNISADGGANFINGWAGVYQGQLTTNTGTQTVNLFCTDVNHDVNPGDTYQIDLSHNLTDAAGGTYVSNGHTYYNGGLASALGAGDFNVINYNSSLPESATNVSYSSRASEVAWLADQFQNRTYYNGASGSTNSSMNASAVNIAIWDIVQDGGDGIHTGNGTVVVDDGSAANYSSLVSYYENLAAGHSSYTSTTAKFGQSPLFENIPTGHYQDFIYSTATPTPEAGTSLALALMCIGGMFLLRRKGSAKPAATAAI